MIEAFDTETINRLGYGYACLIVRTQADTVQVKEFPKTFTEIFQFLVGSDYFCWNMDFDARAICHPHFLLEEKITELAIEGYCQTNCYNFRYIPKKRLSVTDGKQGFTLYDLCQYYGSTLDSASKKFLKQTKKDIPKSWYGLIDKKLQDSNRQKIIDYAIQDVKLTKTLGELLHKSVCGIGIKRPNYTSSGSLASQYVGDYFDTKLADWVQAQVRQSFFGGRIEVAKLGLIGSCKKYDIRSAYPWALNQLADISGLETVVTSKDMAYRPKRDIVYGHYKVDVNVSHNLYYAPLAYRDKNQIIFPSGHFQTYCGYEMLKRLPSNSYRILESLEFVGKPKRLFDTEILKLYQLRQNPEMKLAAKLILNSIYGKCCEERNKSRLLPEIINKVAYHTYHEYGSLTNYVYASYITEMTRLRIWDVLKKYQTKIHMIMTDSVLTDSDVDLKCGNNLGDWNLEGEFKKAVIFGCGRYVLFPKNPKEVIQEVFRGFNVENLTQKLLSCKRDSMKLTRLNTGTMRQYAIGLDQDFNVLRNVKLVFHAGDTKRAWNKTIPKVCDYFNAKIDSTPYILF